MSVFFALFAYLSFSSFRSFTHSSVYLFIYLSIWLSIFSSIYLFNYLSINLYIDSTIYLSIYLSGYLPIFLRIQLPTSSHLPILFIFLRLPLFLSPLFVLLFFNSLPQGRARRGARRPRLPRRGCESSQPSSGTWHRPGHSARCVWSSHWPEARRGQEDQIVLSSWP